LRAKKNSSRGRSTGGILQTSRVSDVEYEKILSRIERRRSGRREVAGAGGF